jgi:DNA polymerase III subunit beta
MKFTVSTKVLAEAATAAARVIGSRALAGAILENAHVTALEDNVAILSTNLGITTSRTIEATVLEDGECTVPAKLFAQYLSSSPAGTIEFTGTNDRVTTKQGRSSYEFTALNPVDFPRLPAGRSSTDTGTIFGDTLRMAVGAVAFAASDDTTRGALAGVLLDAEAGEIVATDGYRLAKFGGLTGLLPVKGRAIITKEDLLEIAKSLSGAGEIQVSLLGSANHLEFSAKNVTISTRLIDGQYPNVKQVIPTIFTSEALLPVGEVISALKRARLLSVDRSDSVDLLLGENSLSIFSESSEKGSATEYIDISYTGEFIKAKVNAGFLLDILARVGTEQVKLQLNGAEKPQAWSPVESHGLSEVLYILMPLRA